MSNTTALVGVGGGIVGLLIGTIVSGPNLGDLETRLADKIEAQGAAAAEATEERFAALEERLGGMQAALDTASEASSGVGDAVASQIEGAVTSLSGKLDTVSETINQNISAASASQAATLKESLSGNLEQITSAVGAMTVAAAPAAATATTTAAASGDAATETVAAPPVELEIDGVKVGQTEQLLDGKARVFVSGIDSEAGTARVAVNGLGLQVLGGYQDVTFAIGETPCTLNLDAIVQGHVQMSATCAE